MIGEIVVENRDSPEEEISMTFKRLGGVGNHKHLIQDADFQLEWATREQELLITQDRCDICSKKMGVFFYILHFFFLFLTSN